MLLRLLPLLLPTLSMATPQVATSLTLELQAFGRTSTHELVIMADAVRVYSPAAGLEGVYDAATDTLQITLGNDGPSVVANRDSVAALASRLQVETDTLERSLDALPPEHAKLSRLRMQQLFKRPEDSAEGVAVDRALASGDDHTLHGIRCKGYRLRNGDAEVGTGCFASPHALVHGRTLAAMLALVHDLYLALQQAAPAYVGWVLPSDLLSSMQPGFGIPLRLTIVNNRGDITTDWSVSGIRQVMAAPQRPE